MPLPADDFAAPQGDSFKFENLGDTVEGKVAYCGNFEPRINQFNGKNEEVARIGLDTGNGEIAYVWPVKGTAMAQAIAAAVREAGMADLDVGDTLKLGYVENKDTGKPQPMKVFRARATKGDRGAVAAAGAGASVDEF